jgi:hypothetical protein
MVYVDDFDIVSCEILYVFGALDVFICFFFGVRVNNTSSFEVWIT